MSIAPVIANRSIARELGRGQSAWAQVVGPEQHGQQRDRQEQQVEHRGQAVADVRAAEDLRCARQQADVVVDELERTDHDDQDHEHEDADRCRRHATARSLPGQARSTTTTSIASDGNASDRQQGEDRVGVEADHRRLALATAARPRGGRRA